MSDELQDILSCMVAIGAILALIYFGYVFDQDERKLKERCNELGGVSVFSVHGACVKKDAFITIPK